MRRYLYDVARPDIIIVPRPVDRNAVGGNSAAPIELSSDDEDVVTVPPGGNNDTDLEIRVDPLPQMAVGGENLEDARPRERSSDAEREPSDDEAAPVDGEEGGSRRIHREERERRRHPRSFPKPDPNAKIKGAANIPEFAIPPSIATSEMRRHVPVTDRGCVEVFDASQLGKVDRRRLYDDRRFMLRQRRGEKRDREAAPTPSAPFCVHLPSLNEDEEAYGEVAVDLDRSDPADSAPPPMPAPPVDEDNLPFRPPQGFNTTLPSRPLGPEKVQMDYSNWIEYGEVRATIPYVPKRTPQRDRDAAATPVERTVSPSDAMLFEEEQEIEEVCEEATAGTAHPTLFRRYLVVDTCSFLAFQPATLQKLLPYTTNEVRDASLPVLIIPQAVCEELEYQQRKADEAVKEQTSVLARSTAVSSSAYKRQNESYHMARRRAMLVGRLPVLRQQKRDECVRGMIPPGAVNDDLILSCAAYFAQTKNALLVTNDKVLQVKAVSEGVDCCTSEYVDQWAEHNVRMTANHNLHAFST